jgi:hypothetical protein
MVRTFHTSLRRGFSFSNSAISCSRLRSLANGGFGII